MSAKSMGNLAEDPSAVRRHYSPKHDREVVNIQAGDCYVTDTDEGITTVLGSCIAACVRSPSLGIGGMNHFMLPASNSGGQAQDPGFAMRYGAYAMEYLINEILRRGGDRASLEVKLFGGASVMASLSDVGERNIAFARDFLKTEGFKVSSEDLGDVNPRRVMYFPATGKAMVKRLQEVSTTEIASREQEHMRAIASPPKQQSTPDIELF
ncbi:MAG: chemoreceptor glutamine deamidase CheD [Pseudomonadota bacterium]